MNIRELTTWNRLLSLDFDAADAALPFSARLACDNDWSRGFAAKAIEEYRKFCFLAVHAGHPVTPSEEVDQVWHLHLLYSRNYWETLCRDTLETPLHHGPTEGGAAEGRKYHACYEDTLASYRRYFGEPPQKLWPAVRERFDERNDFVRLNRRDVVTLDRARLRRGGLAALATGGVLAAAHALGQTDAVAQGGAAGAGLVLLAIVVVAAISTLAVVGRRRRARARRKGDGAAVAGGAAGAVGCSSGHASKGGDGGTDGGHSGCGGASGCSGGGCGGGGCGGS